MDMPVDIPTLELESPHESLNMRQILISAPCIQNQINVIILHLGDHRVIDRPAVLIGEHRQRPGPGGKPLNISNHQRLEEPHAVLALEAEPAHVGDVEEAPIGAAIERRIHDRILVLDRHAPPGERHHLPAILDVEVVERCLLQVCITCKSSPRRRRRRLIPIG